MKRWHNWHIFRQGSDTPVLTVRARHETGALLVAYKKLDLPIIKQRQLSARRAETPSCSSPYIPEVP